MGSEPITPSADDAGDSATLDGLDVLCRSRVGTPIVPDMGDDRLRERVITVLLKRCR